MVAISLYRGDLHKVPELLRRCSIPPHKISVQVFKSLLKRRSRALSRALSASPSASTSSNPNLNVNGAADQSDEFVRENVAILDVSEEISKVGGHAGPFSEVKNDDGGQKRAEKAVQELKQIANVKDELKRQNIALQRQVQEGISFESYCA